MIINKQRRLRVAEESLRDFARTLARALGVEEEEFTVALVSARAMTRLNRRYRGKAGPTDVLSFPAQRSPRSNGYRGDVVIGVETARRNARRLGHSLEEELKLLTLHGLLHLLGYDHETDRGQMVRREHQWRRGLGLE